MRELISNLEFKDVSYINMLFKETLGDILINAIDNFYRQLRNVTKSKTVFPNDDSPLKRWTKLKIKQESAADFSTADFYFFCVKRRR